MQNGNQHQRQTDDYLSIEIAENEGVGPHHTSPAADRPSAREKVRPLLAKLLRPPTIEGASNDRLTDREPSTERPAKPKLGTRLWALFTAAIVGVSAVLLVRDQSRLRHVTPLSDPPWTGILVAGAPEFQKQVSLALYLLENQSPIKFSLVTQYVHVVIPADESKRSLTDPQVTPPVVKLAKSELGSLDLCAATLVHEAKHIEQMALSMRFHSGGFVQREVSGIRCETEANEAAAQALRELAAPPYIVESFENDHGTGWSNWTYLKFGTNAIEQFMEDDQVYWPVPLREAMPSLWHQLDHLRKKFTAPQKGVSQ